MTEPYDELNPRLVGGLVVAAQVPALDLSIFQGVHHATLALAVELARGQMAELERLLSLERAWEARTGISLPTMETRGVGDVAAWEIANLREKSDAIAAGLRTAEARLLAAHSIAVAQPGGRMPLTRVGDEQEQLLRRTGRAVDANYERLTAGIPPDMDDATSYWLRQEARKIHLRREK